MREVTLTETIVVADAEQFGRDIAEIAAVGIAVASDETGLADNADRAVRSTAITGAHLLALGWPEEATALWRNAAADAYSRATWARQQS